MSTITIVNKDIGAKKHVIAHYYKALGKYAKNHNIVPMDYIPTIDINTVKFPLSAGPILAYDLWLWRLVYWTKDGYVIYTSRKTR